MAFARPKPRVPPSKTDEAGDDSLDAILARRRSPSATIGAGKATTARVVHAEQPGRLPPRPTGTLPASIGQRSLQLGVGARGNGGRGGAPRVSENTGRVMLLANRNPSSQRSNRAAVADLSSSSAGKSGAHDNSDSSSASDDVPFPDAAYSLEHRADAVVDRLTRAKLASPGLGAPSGTELGELQRPRSGTPSRVAYQYPQQQRHVGGGGADESLIAEGADGHVPGLTAVESDLDGVLFRLARQEGRIERLRQQQRRDAAPPPATAAASSGGAGTSADRPAQLVDRAMLKPLTPMVSAAEMASLVRYSIADPAMAARIRAQAERAASADAQARRSAAAAARSTGGAHPPAAKARAGSDEIADTHADVEESSNTNNGAIQRQLREALQTAPVPAHLQRELADQAQLLHRIEARQREQQDNFASAFASYRDSQQQQQQPGTGPSGRRRVGATGIADKLGTMQRAIDTVLSKSDALLRASHPSSAMASGGRRGRSAASAIDGQPRRGSTTAADPRRARSAEDAQQSRRVHFAAADTSHVGVGTDGTAMPTTAAAQVQAELMCVALPVTIRSAVADAELQTDLYHPPLLPVGGDGSVAPAASKGHGGGNVAAPVNHGKEAPARQGSKTALGKPAQSASSRPPSSRTTQGARHGAMQTRAAAIAAAYRAPIPGTRGTAAAAASAARRRGASANAATAGAPQRNDAAVQWEDDAAEAERFGSGDVAVAHAQRPPMTAEEQEALAAAATEAMTLDASVGRNRAAYPSVAERALSALASPLMIVGCGTPVLPRPHADVREDNVHAGSAPPHAVRTSDTADHDTSTVMDVAIASDDVAGRVDDRIQRGVRDMCLAAWVSGQLRNEGSHASPAAGCDGDDDGAAAAMDEQLAEGVVEASVRDFLQNRMQGDTREALAELHTAILADRTRPTPGATRLGTEADREHRDEALELLQGLIMSHVTKSEARDDATKTDGAAAVGPEASSATPRVDDGASPKNRLDTTVAETGVGTSPPEQELVDIDARKPGGLPPLAGNQSRDGATDADTTADDGAAQPTTSGRTTPASELGGSRSGATSGVSFVIGAQRRGSKAKKPLAAASGGDIGLPAMGKSIAASAKSSSAPGSANTTLNSAASPSAGAGPSPNAAGGNAPGMPSPLVPQSKTAADGRVDVAAPTEAKASYVAEARREKEAARRIDLMTEAARTECPDDEAEDLVVDIIELPPPTAAAAAGDGKGANQPVQGTLYRLRNPRARPDGVLDVATETVILSDSDSSSDSSSTSDSSTSSSSTSSSSSSSSSSSEDSVSSSRSGGRRRRSRRRARESTSMSAVAEAAVAKFVDRVCGSPLWMVPSQMQMGRSGGFGSAANIDGGGGELRVQGTLVDPDPADLAKANKAAAAASGATVASTAPAEDTESVRAAKAERARSENFARTAALQAGAGPSKPRIPLVPPAADAPVVLPVNPRVSSWVGEVAGVYREWAAADAASHVPDAGIPTAAQQRELDRANNVAPGISEPPSTATSDTHASSFDYVHGTHRFAWPPGRGPQQRMPAYFRKAMRNDDTATSDDRTTLTETTVTSNASTSSSAHTRIPQDGNRPADISSVTSHGTTSPDASGDAAPSSLRVAALDSRFAPPPIGYAPERNPFVMRRPIIPVAAEIDASFASWSNERFSYASHPPGATPSSQPPQRADAGTVWPPPWRAPVVGADSSPVTVPCPRPPSRSQGEL